MARKHLTNQVKKAAFALIAIMKRLNHPPIPVMLELYESMIKLIMCYGSEIWGFKEDKELERIELWFLRSILHLPNSAVGMAVRGELGQLPLYLWWKERLLNYWNRLCG